MSNSASSTKSICDLSQQNRAFVAYKKNSDIPFI